MAKFTEIAITFHPDPNGGDGGYAEVNAPGFDKTIIRFSALDNIIASIKDLHTPMGNSLKTASSVLSGAVTIVVAYDFLHGIWSNEDIWHSTSEADDGQIQTAVGQAFLNYVNLSSALIAGKLVVGTGLVGFPLLFGLLSVTVVSSLMGRAIDNMSPELQEAIGRRIVNIAYRFISPSRPNTHEAFTYWRAYYYAKERGVSESDPALSELRGLAAWAGQEVWGPNWTIEDFGLNEKNFPYGERLSVNATLLRWPGAFMYAWDQWREANDLLTSTIQSEHLKEFWQSEFIPSAIRKQRILIDPVEGVLVRLIGDNVMGRYDIRCDFNLDDFLDGKTGRPIEFLYDPRTNVVLGANGRHAPKSAITGPCECEDCVDELKPDLGLGDADDKFGNAQRVISPLVIDLTRTGITKIGKENGVHFDLDNTGFAQRTAWIGGGAGFLALDRNGNGVIDNGGELFGDFTLLPDGSRARDGFEALRQFDIHGTGVIDKNNPIFRYLVVWIDKNGDGISTPDEIFTLTELGIVAINLNTTAVNTTCPETGILLTCVSTVVFADGSEAKIGDFWFPNCNWDTRFILDFEISEAIAALPNVRSFGRVPTLHAAMQIDESGRLVELVKDFKGSGNADERKVILREILHMITGGADLDPNSRGSNIDARDLHALEELLGRNYFGTAAGNTGANPGPNGARALTEAFGMDFEVYYVLLITQTILKDYMPLVYRRTGTERTLDTSAFNALMKDRIAEGIDVSDIFVEMGRYIRAVHGADSEKFPNVIRGADGNVAVNGFANSNDILFGGNGNNTMRGNGGNNIFIGGQGDDTKIGGNGRNTYKWSPGHGNDTIDDHANNKDANGWGGTLKIGEGNVIKDGFMAMHIVQN